MSVSCDKAASVRWPIAGLAQAEVRAEGEVATVCSLAGIVSGEWRFLVFLEDCKLAEQRFLVC